MPSSRPPLPEAAELDSMAPGGSNNAPATSADEAESGGGGRLVNRALIALAAVLTALAVSIPGAFGRTQLNATPTATPGVTASTITIGGTFPLSGPASLYAPIPPGLEAHFNSGDTRKGADRKKSIRGRRVTWKNHDDRHNPAPTVQP